MITFKRIVLISSVLLILIACKKPIVESPIIPTPPPNPEIKTPKLATNNESSLTQFSVILSGKVIDTVGAKITQLGFVVDTVPNPTITKNLYKFFSQQPDSDGTFAANVTYVPSNTTLYLRAYAVNSFGTGYGNEIKFTTLTQKVFRGNITLSSQQEVNDFGTNHYTTIDGSLYIKGHVTDLSPLLGLSIINYAFEATYTELTNLKGLDSLEVTGAIFPAGFNIEGNGYLINFSGLSKLKYTRGHVQIYFNNSLINLEGLDSYSAASSGELIIASCPKLQNLNGLRKLSFVGSDLYITNNESLTDISGLSNLSTISDRIYIKDNASLQNLNGLEKIQSLVSGIEISGNASLYDLNGLQNLKSVTFIMIKNNPKITDLSVFKQVTELGGLFIENSAGLTNLIGLKNLQTLTGLSVRDNSSLTDLSGLEKITSLESLKILDNSALQSLKGLSGLKKMISSSYSITLGRNSSLKSLTGLENLVQADGFIQIFNNIELNDFCPLKPLFSNGFNKNFSARYNAYNPTQSEVIANCR